MKNKKEKSEIEKAAQRALSYLADLNGSQWITDNGPGGIDMRQRAKSIQGQLFKAINKK
jgi:hypothetical protein